MQMSRRQPSRHLAPPRRSHLVALPMKEETRRRPPPEEQDAVEYSVGGNVFAGGRDPGQCTEHEDVHTLVQESGDGGAIERSASSQKRTTTRGRTAIAGTSGRVAVAMKTSLTIPPPRNAAATASGAS